MCRKKSKKRKQKRDNDSGTEDSQDEERWRKRKKKVKTQAEDSDSSNEIAVSQQQLPKTETNGLGNKSRKSEKVIQVVDLEEEMNLEELMKKKVSSNIYMLWYQLSTFLNDTFGKFFLSKYFGVQECQLR